jgi:predicted DNA-binding antitoxin AbrB/MazE fold protein
MTTTVEAIYEKGILRLSRPIELADGTPVEVIVRSRATAPAPDARAAAKVLAELAALAIESNEPTSVARDHDRYLYGKP